MRRTRPLRTMFHWIWIGALLATSTASGAAAQDGDDSECPYLRLALSTPIGADDEELQTLYRDRFAAELERVGFDVTGPTPRPFSWEAYTQVRAVGDGDLIWSFAFLPMPAIRDGAVRFATFSRTLETGERVGFNSTHYLNQLPRARFAIEAIVAANSLAEIYLPAARELCREPERALEQAKARVEAIRQEIVDEMNRVRRRQQEGVKKLELDVESP